MRPLALAAILAAVSWCVVAARPQQPAPTFKSGIELIELDVTVTDRQHRAVRGLRAADFEVVEDNVPQAISAFRAVDLPDATAYAASWMKDVAPDVVFNRIDAERVVLIVLDDSNVSSNPMDVLTTKRIAHAVVDDLGPLDMAGVLYTFMQQESQEFTTDRSRLNAAIDRFTSQAFPPMGGTPSGACQAAACVHAVLQQAAKALNGWPGKRKMVAFVSPQPTFNNGLTNIEQNAFMDNINARDDHSDLAQTFRALREAHVNVYQYDPRGVTGAGIDTAFGVFAGNTGGRAVTFTNEPEKRVPEMFVENSSFYMLGYQPTNPNADGKFRTLAVRVKNHPDLSVSTRSGYYAPNAVKQAKADKKLPPSVLDRAMTSLLPDGELPMGLSVAPFALPDGKAALVIVSGLDRSPESPARDTVDVAARAYDETRIDRRSRGVATAKIALTHRPTTGTVHYDVSTRLDVDPGRYEVRVALTSPATNLTGSAFASVTVPDFVKDPLNLSGIVLARLPALRPSGRDALGGLLPVVPTTVRTFARGERVGAYLRVYEGGKAALAPVTLHTRVVTETDLGVFDQTVTVPPAAFNPVMRAAKYRVELPLARLTRAGEYLFAIEASSGRTTARRNVRFKIG